MITRAEEHALRDDWCLTLLMRSSPIEVLRRVADDVRAGTPAYDPCPPPLPVPLGYRRCAGPGCRRFVRPYRAHHTHCSRACWTRDRDWRRRRAQASA